MYKLIIYAFIISTFVIKTTFANDLPALPENEIISQDNNQKSLWQKFISFFSSDKIEENNVVTSIDSKDIKPEEMHDNKISNAPDKDDDEAQKLTDELFTNINNKLSTESTEINDNKAQTEEKISVPLAHDLPEIKQDNLSDNANIKLSESDVTASLKKIDETAEKLTDDIDVVTPKKTDETAEKLTNDIDSGALDKNVMTLGHKDEVKEQNTKTNIIATTDNHLLPEETKDSNHTVKKFKDEIEKRKVKRIDELTLISEDELKAKESIIDPKQLKFVSDEAKVLVLPNDEVVLGELTEEANSELIDFNTYIKIFWENYDKVKNQPFREKIETFIEHYNENFNSEDFKNEFNEQTIKEAYRSIDGKDVNKFLTLLNSYNIINVKDDEQNSLLHYAAKVGNYSAAKILIIKGIDLNLINNNNETALSIAQKFKNYDIVNLINSAISN